MKKVLQATKIKDIEPHVMQMMKTLFAGESYTSKLSGLQLIPTVYTSMTTGNQQELMKYVSLPSHILAHSLQALRMTFPK